MASLNGIRKGLRKRDNKATGIQNHACSRAHHGDSYRHGRGNQTSVMEGIGIGPEGTRFTDRIEQVTVEPK